jgi:hypothetical protein
MPVLPWSMILDAFVSMRVSNSNRSRLVEQKNPSSRHEQVRAGALALEGLTRTLMRAFEAPRENFPAR